MKRILLILTLACLMLLGITLPAQSSSGPADDELVIIGRSSVNAVEWSGDGKHLAIGTPYGIWIYNEHLEEVSKIPMEHNPDAQFPGSFQWNGNGDKLLFFYSWYDDEGNDLTDSIIWDINQQKQIASLGMEEHVRLAKRHPTEDMLLVQMDNEIRLYLLGENDLVLRNTVSVENRISFLGWSPDGQYISMLIGERVEVWDTTLDKIIATFAYPESNNTYTRLKWSNRSDRPTILFWADETIYSLDVETEEVTLLFTSDELVRESYSFNPYDDQIAFETEDQTIQIIDMLTGEVTQLERLKRAGHTIEWARENYVVSTAGFGEVFVWDTQTRELIYSLDLGYRGRPKLAWQQGTNYLTVVTPNSLVHLIDVDNQAIVKTLHEYNSRISSAYWSQDGNYLVVSSGDYGDLNVMRTQVWDVATGTLVQGIEQPWTTEYPLSNPFRFLNAVFGTQELPSIFWSPDGERYIAQDGEHIHLWNALDNRLILTIPDLGRICSVSVDFNYIKNCVGQIWDVNSGQMTLDNLSYEFAWHPLEETFAVSTGHNLIPDTFDVDIIDASTHELRSTLTLPATISEMSLEEYPSQVSEFSWSRDGSLFLQVMHITHFPDAFYAIVDVKTNAVVASGTYSLPRISWHPSEIIIATSNFADGRQFIEILELPSMTVLDRFEVPLYLLWEDRIYDLVWSPNGEKLAIVHEGDVIFIKEHPVP